MTEELFNKDEYFRARLRDGIPALKAIAPYIYGGDALVEAVNVFHDMTYPNKRPPKYKRVDLDAMKKKISTGSVAFGQNETSATTTTVDYIYNRAIEDIKSKYGDLYAEVKQ
jgi:hypothetical protein